MDESADVRRRFADSAAAAAARAYEAAHGNPVPSEARGLRWRAQPRLIATVTVLIGLGGALAWTSAGAGAPAPAIVPLDSSASAAPRAVLVHVAGAVADAGLVEVEAGARAGDAIAAAGGFTSDADQDALNLARVVQDGEQLYVPTLGEHDAGPVNLNRASADELERLPGVGPVLAARIVEFRTEHGGFASVADLARVSGVGESLVAGLSGLATV